MVNTLQKPDNTLYTTPKMIVGSVAADIVWQLFSQFVDPLFEHDKVGQMPAVDFMSIFYPFLITGLVWGGSRFHSYINMSHVDQPDNHQNEMNQHREEDKEIAAAILLSMAGWMCAYFLAAALDMGRWKTVAAVGVGSAIPIVLYSRWNDVKNNKEVSNDTYAALALSVFVSGMAWYVCYCVPGMLEKSGFSENHVAGGFVSTYFTAIASAAALGGLKLYENYKSPSV